MSVGYVISHIINIKLKQVFSERLVFTNMILPFSGLVNYIYSVYIDKRWCMWMFNWFNPIDSLGLHKGSGYICFYIQAGRWERECKEILQHSFKIEIVTVVPPKYQKKPINFHNIHCGLHLVCTILLKLLWGSVLASTHQNTNFLL